MAQAQDVTLTVQGGLATPGILRMQAPGVVQRGGGRSGGFDLERRGCRWTAARNLLSEDGASVVLPASQRDPHPPAICPRPSPKGRAGCTALTPPFQEMFLSHQSGETEGCTGEPAQQGPAH